MTWDKSTVFYATQMALHSPHSSKWKCFRLHVTLLSSPSTGYLGMNPVLAQRGPDMLCSTLEKQEGRTDNSHEVHVDNCILNAEALVCVKEPPAYTFRDYRYCWWLSVRVP